MTNLHLHHLENSRSFRIVWLLEELGLDYQLTKYERTASYLAPKSLENIHPLGKAPVLEIIKDESDGSDETLTLIESGHIIDYLMSKYDTDYKFHPKVDADSQTWQDYDFWMHFSEASAMPPLVMRLVFTKVVEASPTIVKPVAKAIRKKVEASMIAKNIAKSLDLVEAQLNEHKWFSGSEFSAADIQMGFVIEAANAGQGLDVVRYTNTLNWLKRCQARSAYKQAVEKGGKLDF